MKTTLIIYSAFLITMVSFAAEWVQCTPCDVECVEAPVVDAELDAL